MKPIISASAALLLASIGMAPLAAAQTRNQPLPQPAVSQPAMQPAAVSRHGQQSILPPSQIQDLPAQSARTGSGFNPYPPGWDLYGHSSDD